MLSIRPKCIFYVKENTFRHAAIKISHLEFSGTKLRSEAVLIARQSFYQRSDHLKYRFDSYPFFLGMLQSGSVTFFCLVKEQKYLLNSFQDIMSIKQSNKTNPVL